MAQRGRGQLGLLVGQARARAGDHERVRGARQPRERRRRAVRRVEGAGEVAADDLRRRVERVEDGAAVVAPRAAAGDRAAEVGERREAAPRVPGRRDALVDPGVVALAREEVLVREVADARAALPA